MKYPKIYLALDNCFAIKRWIEPRDWMKLTSEIGFKYAEASFDNEIDGLFSPEEYMDDWFAAIDKYGKEFDVEVANFFTGYQTYRTAGLAHPDERMVRHLMEKWLKPMLKRLSKISAGMGLSFFAFPDKVLQNPKLYHETYQAVVRRICELTDYMTETGGVNLCIEQMYAPHQPPWTIQGTIDFLRDCYLVNQKSVYTTVDVGHVIGQNKFLRPTVKQIVDSFSSAAKENGPGIWLGSDASYEIWKQEQNNLLNPHESAKRVAESMNDFAYLFSQGKEDSDPYAWLENLACYSPIIHMQQTDGKSAPHAAFTPQTNESGIIEGEKLLKAIAKSYENSIPGMPPKADNIYLSFEIFASNTEYKSDIIDKLKLTADYWRRYVPFDGVYLDQLIEVE